MRYINQQRLELLTTPFVAASCEGTQRVAVIALTARNYMFALRLANLDKVLPSQLERSLDSFRST
ncbi:hypothetical protein D3C76_1804110 [compost metagenome]